MPGTYEAEFDRLSARQARIAAQAAALGAREIHKILAELNARFPRHRFYFTQGMGTYTVYSDKRIFGQDYVSPLIAGEVEFSQAAERFPVFRYLTKRVGRICEIADQIDETFSADIGPVDYPGTD